MSIEIEKRLKIIEKIAKNGAFFKKLIQRRFNYQYGYLDFKVAMFRVAVWYTGITHSLSFGQVNADRVNSAIMETCFDMHRDSIFPVYAISKDLTDLFFNTDLPSKLIGIKKPFYQAVLMLPSDEKRLIRDSGHRSDFVYIKIMDRDSYMSKSRDEDRLKFLSDSFGITLDQLSLSKDDFPINEFFVHCASFTAKGDVITHGFGISEQGDLIDFGDDFISSISKIVLQFILYLQIQNEKPKTLNKSGTTALKNTSSGFSTNVNKAKNFIYVDCEETSTSNPTSNTKRSPNSQPLSVHWRRGHWRNVLTGEGRTVPKIVWVRPSIIGLQKTA